MIDPYEIANANGWTYFGDVDMRHGGTFIRIDDLRNYADVVEIIDADGACSELEGQTWIESRTVPLGMAWRRQARSGFDVMGMKVRDLAGMSRTTKAVQIAYATHVYGCSDPVESMDALTDASEHDIANAIEDRLT